MTAVKKTEAGGKSARVVEMISGTSKGSIKPSHFGFFMLSASSDQFEINEQQFVRILLLFPDGQAAEKANSCQVR